MEYNKNTAKLIRSLKDKKARDESGLFVVEGEKLVEEALRSGWTVELLLRVTGSDGFAGESRNDPEFRADQAAGGLDGGRGPACTYISPAEMEKISLLRSPSPALALVRIPQAPPDGAGWVAERPLALALDGVRDPGNLGTILRLADWFGVDWIFASDVDSRYPTSDIYNPKVVQATMGAIFRTRLIYAPLPEIAQLFIRESMDVYGTFLDGKPIYAEPLAREGLIVMGNESEGVSPEMAACVTRRLTIPSYPVGVPTSESLNVATATAITLSEFRRR